MAVMKEFKPGDRVEYACDHFGLHGHRFVTIKAIYGEWAAIEEPAVGRLALSNLRHITSAPDVITINRSDLPEVRRDGYNVTVCGRTTYIGHPDSARYYREDALRYLAIAEYLDAQDAAKETAEMEAADKLAKRRDEIAREVAKRAFFVAFDSFTYQNHASLVQAAIDMIIEEQDEAKQ